MNKKINWFDKFLIKHVLLPWALKRKGDILALLMRQDSYRNKVTMALYKTDMGWTSINRALAGMGFKTVKAYYMTKEGPYLFFDMPSPERRAEIQQRLYVLR